MDYLNSKEHKEHLARMQRIDDQWAELDKRIEQSRAEMQWVLQHRGKIWLACFVFWALILWGIFK